MSEFASTSSIKSLELQATVIRADGTREDLGVVGSWHRNPFVRLWRFITGRK